MLNLTKQFVSIIRFGLIFIILYFSYCGNKYIGKLFLFEVNVFKLIFLLIIIYSFVLVITLRLYIMIFSIFIFFGEEVYLRERIHINSDYLWFFSLS